MVSGDNTLFLRLAGPMQAWGTSSRFQLRRTDLYPSKSAMLGMLLCAKGVRREDSRQELQPLAALLMGVRVDRSGILGWDYHTAGAKIGIRSAAGNIKKTVSTGEYETLLSRRQYLYDASYLVALQGDTKIIAAYAGFLDSPAWSLFLGRKCCVPTEPVFAGTGSFSTLTEALSSIPWRPRISAIDGGHTGAMITLDTYLEHQPGTPPPKESRLIYDVPEVFGFYSYTPRWIFKNQVKVVVDAATHKQQLSKRGNPYSGHFYNVARPNRLKLDSGLCVFCKSPATEVHHVSYDNAGHETDSDLRSLCEICHSACTMLEYSHGRKERVDPCDPAQRPEILAQVERIVGERRTSRRRELLKAARGQFEI
jgi:CRISPR system Cascade subunit CasD